MKELFEGKVNSPPTYLDGPIDDGTVDDDEILVVDASVLPDPPNICTIGRGTDCETIRYEGVSSNLLTGCTRGFQGTAKSWADQTQVARMFTEHDHAGVHQRLLTGDLSGFPGYYVVTEFDEPTAGDITETMYDSEDDVFLTRVTEFDEPTSGDITVTLECTELGIHTQVVTEFDAPSTGDITETASEVV